MPNKWFAGIKIIYLVSCSETISSLRRSTPAILLFPFPETAQQFVRVLDTGPIPGVTIKTTKEGEKQTSPLQT